jgi:hypothetical protein
MKKILVLLSLLTISFAASSQKPQSKIKGIIKHIDGKPIQNANVLLLKHQDSALVKGTVTDAAGAFAFTNIATGKYLITSTYIGYNQAYSPVLNIATDNDEITAGELVLAPTNVELKEVMVQAKKPLFEQKIDRMVINVKNSITSAGITALDVLEKSPGVMVNRQNNAISISGKEGVIVMINGKINHMPISAVVQMLAGMSSDNIERIELITTPPANFDAEGNAGFINIVLINNPDYGTNGNYSISGGIGKGNTSSANINFNHRKNKINLFGNYSFSRLSQLQFISIYRKVDFNGNTTESYSETDRDPIQRNHNARLGLDYEINKKTIIGGLVSAYDNRWSMDAVNDNITTVNKRPDTLINIINDEINHWKHFMGNLNVQHTFKAEEKLTVDLDYLYYRDNNPVNYFNTYFDGTGNHLFDESTKSGKLTPIKIWVGKADYYKKLGKKLNMETGIKGTKSKFNNDVLIERLVGNEWTADESLSANYELNEYIAALYSTFNINLNDKTDMKIGLRYEHTNSNLGSVQVKNIIDRQYGNLFPSFFIARKINEHNSVNFSYSRRITRPTFNDMAPFVIFMDPKTFFSGNPALRPSISNSVKTDYSYKKFIFSLSYSHDKDAIARFQSRIDPVTNKQYIAAENLNNIKTLSASFSLPFTITKWWNSQNNLNGRAQEVNTVFDGSEVQIRQVNFQLSSSQNFTLPKNFSIELSGFYYSSGLFGLTKFDPFGAVNFGLQKKFGEGKRNLRFGITDIFRSLKINGYTYIPEQYLDTRFFGRFTQRTFNLTYTSNFGNDKLKDKRTRSTGSEDERRRVE